MKILILLAFLPLIVCAQTDVTTQPPRVVPATRFVVVAPFRIRQGKPFNVLIARSGVVKAITVKITISSTSPEFTPIVRSTRISTLISRAFVSFDTSKIPQGEYFLTVEGEGYTEKRALTYAMKDSSILIQLNKALFSPNQLVQGRIYAIDIDTNSVAPREDCEITIHEPAGNIVRRYYPYFSSKGKYNFNLQLSIQPPLGRWNVNVTCGNEITIKGFDVEEHKLPAYELLVNIPQITPLSHRSVPVVITAQYTFGKPVDGTGLFTTETRNAELYTQTVNVVNGHASLEINMDLLHEGTFQYSFDMEDSVLESPASAGGIYQVLDSSYRLDIVGSDLISPGSPYNFTVVMRKFDGSPAPSNSKILLTIDPIGMELNLTSKPDGTAPALIDIPANTSYLEISATATDSLDGYLSAKAPTTNVGSFVDLFAGLNKRNLGELVQIILTVSDDIEFVNYVITSKGVVLASDHVTFSVGKRQTSIWFRPNFNYAASCQVVAFYVNKNGDFVTGKTHFEFRDKLPNYVKLSFDESKVTPGTNYPFNVESQCDSTVSLTAIDQRSLLLRQGHNVVKEDVFEKLSMYEKADGLILENRPYFEHEQDFNDVGTITFTNIPANPDLQNRRTSLLASSSSMVLPSPSDVRVRTDFSETFCWIDVVTQTSKNCSALVTCKVPESLTSYFVYSVAMSEKYGMGLTDIPATITTFLPFFMAFDLPYSINRNEILVLDIVFFNNINQAQDIVISIPKTAFFVGVDIATYGWEESETEYTKDFHAETLTNFKIQFALKSNFIGIFNFEVAARGPLAGDAIRKVLRVVPVGIPRTITSSTIVMVETSDTHAEDSLECVYPDGVYEDTEEVVAQVAGNLIGNALNNLDRLVVFPTGCGEQRLVNFAVSLAIHNYLKVTGKLNTTLEEKLHEIERQGYQNVLSLRRSDGGFSFFSGDTTSSTWLTAYAVKILYDARLEILVDMDVVRGGVDFLMSKQQSDGRFIETTSVYSSIQGGVNGGIAMTAYITIVMQHILSVFNEYWEQNQLALDYLALNVDNVTNVYELGVVSYALVLEGYDPEASDAFDRFFDMRFETPTTIEWMVVEGELNYRTSTSLDVEVSAYGLRSLIEYGRLEDAIKVVKFLMTQTNPSGGFKSSQDTVVALEALSLFARVVVLDSDLHVTLTPNVGPQFNVIIEEANALAVQQYPLNRSTTELDIFATSINSGLAVVSLICSFYQDPAKIVSSFDISYQFTRSCQSSVRFTVCARYLPEGTSNMALIQVKLPSGFRNVATSTSNPSLRKTEESDGGSMVTFYLQTIDNSFSCVNVATFRYSFVDALEDGYIIVSDYYDTSREGLAYYEIPDISQTC